MTTNTESALPFTVTPDISERAEDLKRRLIAGEMMTMETLATVIGLPFEFIATAIAITVVLKQGIPVSLDPAAMPKPH